MTTTPTLIGTPNIDRHRSGGDNPWDLPEWGHPLAEAIFPLFVSADRQLLPIATAFCVSTLGIVATAHHNILEALRHHRYGDALRTSRVLPKNYDLDDIGFTLLHHFMTGDDVYTANFWPLERVQGAPPTDLVYAFPQFQTKFRYSYFRISFAVPRVGSRVICLGYSELFAPHGPIKVDEVLSGKSSWHDIYCHKFRAVEATVTHIFTQGFTPPYGTGPCFIVDANLEHGMSGGPVLNEDGTVCGVISAGAETFFDRPAGIVALLYPTLLSKVTFGASLGSVRMNATQTILELISTGAVVSDSSETLVTLCPEGDQISIGPMIPREDASFVYDDFRAFQENRIASRESREVYRVRWND